MFDPAMHRSRDAQRGAARRRIGVAAAILFMAVIVGHGGLWSAVSLKRIGILDGAIARAQTLADLIRERSPGRRSEGKLITTKETRALSRQLLAPKPRIRLPARGVMPGIEIAQRVDFAPFLIPSTEFETALPPRALEVSPAMGAATLLPGARATRPPGRSPPGAFSPLGPTIAGPRPSAVPEPGTWESMLLGFGLIGWLVRRRAPSDKSSMRPNWEW